MKFLKGKVFMWTTYVRVFCDESQPKFTLYPVFRKSVYSSYWGMSGFSVCFLGRQFIFSFGKDVNGLFKR
jgi:hypothetical protein